MTNDWTDAARKVAAIGEAFAAHLTRVLAFNNVELDVSDLVFVETTGDGGPDRYSWRATYVSSGRARSVSMDTQKSCLPPGMADVATAFFRYVMNEIKAGRFWVDSEEEYQRLCKVAEDMG